MRRTPLLVAVIGVALLGSVGACGDDDSTSPDSTSPSADQISTEGVCEVLDASKVSQVMGVEFDKAEAGDGSCTYTATATQTAFTLQVTELGTTAPAQALDAMGTSCDAGTRQERTFSGAEGGFSCLAGGVPNVVAAGGGVVLVLTGSSGAEGRTPAQVEDALATILEDAIVSFQAG